jgi:hypothetical protein
MQNFSENQIRNLHSEFRGHKKYAGKLAFFDQLFGIIPFPFPDFDPRLGFLIQKEKIDNLYALYKKERNNPDLTEKRFSFGETFVFNIKPANSNSSVYNQYLLGSFLSRQPNFDDWNRQRISDMRPIESFLEEANGIMNTIECCLKYDSDKSFRLQCMSIFYKGFYDGFSGRLNMADKKRKFTELFLYAQGIIYSRYTDSLKTEYYKYRYPVELKKRMPIGLEDKIALLFELGIIDFLHTGINKIFHFSNEKNLAEIICQITGENADRQTEVLKILDQHAFYKQLR